MLTCLISGLMLAQAPLPPAMEPEPQWLKDLREVQQQIYQNPGKFLDQKAQQAWQAALATPQHPQFQQAATITLNLYQSQGYDLKAEQLLQQAISLIPPDQLLVKRQLRLHLASHYETIGQLVKAVGIREQMIQEPFPAEGDDSTGFSFEINAFANLYERMGEMEKAESLWGKATELGKTQKIAAISGSAPFRGGISSNRFGYRFQQQYLADFYIRRERPEEAEKIYRKALAEATAPEDWVSAADGYILMLTQQRRFAEAIELQKQSFAKLDASADPQAFRTVLYRRQSLSNLLEQAGQLDEALAIEKQAVSEAQKNGTGSPEYMQALNSLTQMLMRLNRLDEAEEAIEQTRVAASASKDQLPFAENMAVQALARIRKIQNKPDEARKLRESIHVPSQSSNQQGSLHHRISSLQQNVLRGNVDVVLVDLDGALALAAEKIPDDPRAAGTLISLANILMGRQKLDEARRIVLAILPLLNDAPDHPGVADVLGSLTYVMTGLEMGAEIEQAMARQEKILIAAKGPESLALNAVHQSRLLLMQRNSDWSSVVDERKRILDRTEKLTGLKSMESFHALRELAWAYPPSNQWSEEQVVLSRLQERTGILRGTTSSDYAHILFQLANRNADNQQFDQALAFMDQGIEIIRNLPDGQTQLPGWLENRVSIVNRRDALLGGKPFIQQNGGMNNNQRWFDTSQSLGTNRPRFGGRAERGVMSNLPSVNEPSTIQRIPYPPSPKP